MNQLAVKQKKLHLGAFKELVMLGVLILMFIVLSILSISSGLAICPFIRGIRISMKTMS